MKKMLFAFVLCLLVQGCVTTSMLRLDPQAQSGQRKESQAGVDAIVSEKKVLVTVRPSSTTFSSEERPKLVISVYSAEEPFSFSTKNIQILVDGNPQRVFTYDELAADIREQEKTAKEKAQKMKEAQYMTGGGSMATNSANNQYTASLIKIEENTIKSLKDLDANYLKDTRVSQSKQYSGHVTMEKIPNTSQSHEIKVIVTALGDTHEFLLNQFEVK